MSIVRGFILTTASLTVLASGPAAAATAVSIAELKSRYLFSGTTVNGSFDFTPFLSDRAGQKYVLSSLSFSVAATSPNTQSDYGYLYTDAQSASRQVAYSCGLNYSGICYRTVFYTEYVPVYGSIDRTIDAVSIDVINTVASSETKYQSNQNVYSSGFYGDLFASANVTGGDLDLVNSSGVMQYSISGRSNGLIILNDTTVTFDLLAISTAVPEPASWAMMLIGFAMVAGAARYLRRSEKVSLA